MIRQMAKRPFWSTLTTLLIVPAYVMSVQGLTLAAAGEVDENRIETIAAQLSGKTAGFGLPIDNRRIWKKLLEDDSFRNVISEAEKLLEQAIPAQPDDLYLDFSRTGNRTRWQRVSGRRRVRIGTFSLAECLENKGRFMPAFEEIVRALCSERTCWKMLK